MAKAYTYRIIDCYEACKEFGIHDKKALLDFCLNDETFLNNGWRFHSFIESDAFGVKSECPLIILEKEK